MIPSPASWAPTGEPPRLAHEPPEARGIERDEVALLVSDAGSHQHTTFRQIAACLRPGDLLVVNDSRTLAASLRATSTLGEVTLNLATRFGRDLWLAEPRWGPELPGPLPLGQGERLDVGGIEARLIAPYPGAERLWFVRLDGDAAMTAGGAPVRYGYLAEPQPLEAYQTVFARTPGSAEMPSAGRPFSGRVLASLQAAGVEVASITLHAGLSSLEVDLADVAATSLPPEPFAVPPATARAVSDARARGGRVIAVGTTVVRALESAVSEGRLTPMRGFTRRVLHPGRPARIVDGLLTGFHEPRSSHLALLLALADERLVESAYREAAAGPYLWHEFGDVHLILPNGRRAR